MINLRDLSNRIADHPRIETAVMKAIRAELPIVIETILCELYPGETVRIYSPMKPVHMRRQRDEAIRAEYNGRNAKALSKKYGPSPSQICRIANPR